MTVPKPREKRDANKTATARISSDELVAFERCIRPRSTPGEPIIKPPCVASPSPITRRFLEVWDAGHLYHLLHLPALDPAARELHDESIKAAEAEAARLEREVLRWDAIYGSLVATVRELREATDERKLSEVLHPACLVSHATTEERSRGYVLVDAIDQLRAWAREAKDIADKLDGTFDPGGFFVGNIEEAQSRAEYWSPYLRAKAAAERSPLYANEWTHLRVKALYDHRPDGCTQADIADLIVASEHDWHWDPESYRPQRTPVRVPSGYRYEWNADNRTRDPNREKLVQWVKDQLRAPARNAKRRRRVDNSRRVSRRRPKTPS